MSMTFSGQVALVTGAAAGIGRATAQAFAAEGLKVVVSDVDVAGGEGTVELIRAAGGDACFVRCDVTRDAEVKALMEAALSQYGRLDYAFNNAGIEIEQGKLADGNEAEFDAIMGVNVKGVWLCMKHQIPLLLAQGGGAIVNTASVAGLGAARLVASHYSILVKDIGAMFVAGPPVVKHIGEDLDKQELGGHLIQTAAGGVDHAAESEADAFECARRFLSYLPSSVYDVASRGKSVDDAGRQDEMLDSIIPKNTRKVYRMRKIINSLVDKGSFFEMGMMFGRSMITGFARLDGWPVALMASDPHFYAGAWTSDACDKITRFVDMAETFHLPLVYLADCPGFLVGGEAERTATIRHGVRTMSAINQSTTPWCSIIVRNSFGVAGAAHRPVGRYSVRYAWYTARWGSLPLEGGIEAAYRAEIDKADDPAAKLAEIEKRLNQLRSPYRTAETFWIEDIIEPHKTRPLLCDFANLAAPLRTPGQVSFGMRP